MDGDGTPTGPARGTALEDAALAQLFTAARTHRHWLARELPAARLRELYELVKWGPTSGNCLPGRFVFVVSAAAKARLKPVLEPGNVGKTMAAPATVIVAHDSRFYELLAKTNPRSTAAASFAADAAAAAETAFRNGSLQGAYLLLAARALGLDCGPMSGFDNARLDAEFFPDGRWRSNFLVNLGYGDPAALHPRQPRLDFDEACRVL